MSEFRTFDPEKHGEAAFRIYQEVGWADKDKGDLLKRYLAIQDGMVVEISGEAECLVTTTPGDLRYLNETLPLCAVMGVTTSRVARKLGFASRLCAAAVAKAAAAGAKVAALGMFEQGFYNRLGFGTGPYEVYFLFEPNQLLVSNPTRPPRRLTKAEFAAAHAARLSRLRGHGSVNLLHPNITGAEMEDTTNGFGLGYADGENGTLSHYLWVSAKDTGHGPYHIRWMAYRNWTEFRELLSLVKALGEQVRLVGLEEPPGIQFQDFLKQPFLYRQLTDKGKYEHSARARAFWQMRILDLEGCLSQTHLLCPSFQLNLHLSDPIQALLDETSVWKGCAGDYILTLGEECALEPGTDPALPALTASMGAFSRLWLGGHSATSLSISDELSGSPELLESLDRAFRLPVPKPDWDF